MSNVKGDLAIGHAPYVVSGDIENLMKQWAISKDFILPKANFFNELRNNFNLFMKQIFSQYEYLSEDTLCKEMREFVPKEVLAISLDRVYYPTQYKIDITRCVDDKLQNMGVHGRNGVTLEQQIGKLPSWINQVTLVDDVIYSGSVISKVVEKAQVAGISIKDVYVAIAIAEGVNSLSSFGITVHALHEYPVVIDEICERDFWPGIPLCGRTLYSDQRYGVPYLKPFGLPLSWASIPEEWHDAMSKFCIAQTINLFKEIETLSDRKVKCSDLDRRVYNMDRLADSDDFSFVDLLSEYMY